MLSDRSAACGFAVRSELGSSSGTPSASSGTPSASSGTPERKASSHGAKRTARPDGAQLQRLARISVLAAVALALSYVETTIPLPLVFPGAKLGLANIAVLVALFAFDARTAISVAVVKVLAAGFLFGSPLMLAYSLGGTTLALAGMLLLKLIPGVSVVLVSMASAVLHNTGQVLVACALFGTPAVLVSLPPLAVVALVTGFLTGLVAAAVLADVDSAEGSHIGDAASEDLTANATSTKGAVVKSAAAEGEPELGVPVEGAFAEAASAEAVPAVAPSPSASGISPDEPVSFAFGVYRPGNTLAHRLNPCVKIVFVTALFVAAFLVQGWGLAVVAAVAVAAMACSGAGPRQALAWLRPFWGLFLFVAVFDVLFTRTGDVLLAAGAVTVTTGGIAFAVESVARFACMLLGTSSLMATTSPDELTAGVGGLLSPLARLGVPVENITLALSLTLRFVPIVSQEFIAAKRAHDEEMAQKEELAQNEQRAYDDGLTHDKQRKHNGESAPRSPRSLRALVQRMKGFGLAFAPAFANALRRADALALELAAEG